MNARSSADSIEQYAELCARLDTAFPDRASVLRAANLDEAAFVALQARWMAQLIAPNGAAIAESFSAVYSAARRAIVDDRANPGAPQAHRPASPTVQLAVAVPTPRRRRLDDEDTWPADPAGEDRTAEIKCLPAAPPLPFRRAQADGENGLRVAPALRRNHEPSICPASSANDALGSTEQIPVFLQRSPVLPFTAPNQPLRRLHRFDTQTGLPLRTPIWIEDAASADPTKPR